MFKFSKLIHKTFHKILAVSKVISNFRTCQRFTNFVPVFKKCSHFEKVVRNFKKCSRFQSCSFFLQKVSDFQKKFVSLKLV